MKCLSATTEGAGGKENRTIRMFFNGFNSFERTELQQVKYSSVEKVKSPAQKSNAIVTNMYGRTICSHIHYKKYYALFVVEEFYSEGCLPQTSLQWLKPNTNKS